MNMQKKGITVNIQSKSNPHVCQEQYICASSFSVVSS